MAKTEAHEIIHNLGAVTASAPHVCQIGHVCDAGDVMTSGGQADSLFAYAMDVGRDDYYGHPGSWWDVQDSAWLSHLDAPQFPLTVAKTGAEAEASPAIFRGSHVRRCARSAGTPARS